MENLLHVVILQKKQRHLKLANSRFHVIERTTVISEMKPYKASLYSNLIDRISPYRQISLNELVKTIVQMMFFV